MGIVFLYVAYLNRTVNIAIPVFNNFILYLASAILGIYLFNISNIPMAGA